MYFVPSLCIFLSNPFLKKTRKYIIIYYFYFLLFIIYSHVFLGVLDGKFISIRRHVDSVLLHVQHLRCACSVPGLLLH